MKIGRKYGEKEKIQILIKSLIFCILRIYIFSFYAFLFFRSLADAKFREYVAEDFVGAGSCQRRSRRIRGAAMVVNRCNSMQSS